LELRTLCNERVRQAILQRGIELIGFRDLPEPAKAGAIEQLLSQEGESVLHRKELRSPVAGGAGE